MESRRVFKFCVILIASMFVLSLPGTPVRAAHTSSAPAVVPASPPVCPSSLNFGETITCTIGTAHEIDTYTFSASAGDKVLVRVSSLGGIWPEMRVYSPEGPKLCDAYSVGTAEIASCDMPESGTYSIQVDDNYSGTGTGGYDLYLQRLNNPGSPVAIAFGQTLLGSIDTPADMDTFTFAATAGDKVLITAYVTSDSPVWPGIRVYDTDGTQVCEALSMSPTTIPSCTLPVSGAYTILVDDSFNGTQVGHYYLYLQRLNNVGNAAPIGFGQNLLASIDTPAEMDTYTFTAAAGDTMLVRATSSGEGLWPEARVYSPDGTELCEDTSVVSAEIASCSLPVSGTYAVLVKDSHGSSTGSYTLFLQRLNNPGNALSIDFGHSRYGSIAVAGKLDTYTFSANAGDKLDVRMAKLSGSIWPGIRVYGPDGIKLCEDTDEVSCTLPDNGMYTLLTYDRFDGTLTGDYAFYVQRWNNPGGGVSIALGQTLSGSINPMGEIDTYTFTASAGNVVSLWMSGAVGSFWSVIVVYGPDGTMLCTVNAPIKANIASCSLPLSGTYTILAYNGFFGTDTGNYQINLDHYHDPVIISGNAGVAGASINYTDGTAKTATSQADGSYSLSVPYNWSGMVAPVLACYIFSPDTRNYSLVTSNQGSQNFTPTVSSSCANVNVSIAGASQGSYVLPLGGNSRQSYASLNSGPVRVTSTNGKKIVASERIAYTPDGGTTWPSYSEMMGLPVGQLTTSYVMPWYNNADLNTQLRFGNVGSAATYVTVTIGGAVKGTYYLTPNQSQRISYAGLSSGPVQVASSNGVPIIASQRVSSSPDGGTTWTYYSELMGLPSSQLTSTYVMPWYNNADLNTQLRFGNVGSAATYVTVTIGGVAQGTYYLLPNQSQRISYAGLSNGPVKIASSNGVVIIASERVAYSPDGGATWPSFTELMGLPFTQLTTSYVLPVYDNVNLNTQLRFANVGTAPNNVSVTIGGVVKGTYYLTPSQSQRISYAGLNSGPVVIQSSGGVPIIASERVAYSPDGGTTWPNFAEMMGLPGAQLTTTYVMPWYNNSDWNTQLRFAVP